MYGEGVPKGGEHIQPRMSRGDPRGRPHTGICPSSLRATTRVAPTVPADIRTTVPGDRAWCVAGVFVIIVLFFVIDKSVQCSCLFTICFITGVRVYYVRARGFSLAAAYVRTSAAMIPRVGATLAVVRIRGYALPFGGRPQGSPLPCRRTSSQPYRRTSGK